MITDSDGHSLPRAWANAWAGDPEMEGMRIRIEEVDGRLTAVGIHPEDEASSIQWEPVRISAMMDALTAALRDGEVDMTNDEGEEAWQTR